MARSSFDQQYYALLASRVREGDPDAFAELYNATYDTLWRSVCCFFRQPDDIRDAMQEIYMSVYKNIGSLKLDRLLLPWMRQIAYHTCCDMAKEMNAARGLSLEEDVDKSVANHDDPFQQVHARDFWERVNRTLATRPVKERQAFLLRYESGLKLEQIAGFMGVSLATVKRYIASAREALQNDLSYMRP